MGGQRVCVDCECVCGNGRLLYSRYQFRLSSVLSVYLKDGAEVGGCGVLQRWIEFVLKCVMN